MDTIPTWTECCEKSDEDMALTPLERFIFDNEPTAPNDVEWRKQLADVVKSLST